MNKIVAINPEKNLIGILKRIENLYKDSVEIITEFDDENYEGINKVVVSNTKLTCYTRLYLQTNPDSIMVFGKVSEETKKKIIDQNYQERKESMFYVCSLPFVSHFLFVTFLKTSKLIIEEKRKQIDSACNFMHSLGINRLSIGLVSDKIDNSFIDSCFIRMILDDHLQMTKIQTKMQVINGLEEVLNKEKNLINKEKINMLAFQSKETIDKFLIITRMLPEAKCAIIRDYKHKYYIDYSDYKYDSSDEEFLFSILLLMKSSLVIDFNSYLA